MTSRPELLRAETLELPQLRHGFTTRNGGVSTDPFASLNFSPKWPEEREAVAENLRLLAEAAGFDPGKLYTVQQVHRKDGVLVDDTITPEETRAIKADFLLTDQPGRTIAVMTADCVPILLADPEVPAVCAIHGGWRSLAAGIVERAVREMVDLFGADPARMVAGLGPSIGPCCFEVGPEVAEQFAELLGDDMVLPPQEGVRAKQHVDLWAAARRLLGRAGVRGDHASRPRGCTKCEVERFHSYRRQGAKVGQHLSFISLTDRLAENPVEK